jgi:hypothetical protein
MKVIADSWQSVSEFSQFYGAIKTTPFHADGKISFQMFFLEFSPVVSQYGG